MKTKRKKLTKWKKTLGFNQDNETYFTHYSRTIPDEFQEKIKCFRANTVAGGASQNSQTWK